MAEIIRLDAENNVLQGAGGFTSVQTTAGSLSITSVNPLAGQRSYALQGGINTYGRIDLATSIADAYCSFLLRLSTIPGGDTERIVAFRTSAGTRGGLTINTSGQLRLTNAGSAIGSAYQVTLDGSYLVQVRQKAGTGTNAILRAVVTEIATGVATEIANLTTGTWTDPLTRIDIGATSNSAATTTPISMLFDDLVVDDTGFAAPPTPPPTVGGNVLGSTAEGSRQDIFGNRVRVWRTGAATTGARLTTLNVQLGSRSYAYEARGVIYRADTGALLHVTTPQTVAAFAADPVLSWTLPANLEIASGTALDIGIWPNADGTIFITSGTDTNERAYDLPYHASNQPTSPLGTPITTSSRIARAWVTYDVVGETTAPGEGELGWPFPLDSNKNIQVASGQLVFYGPFRMPEAGTLQAFKIHAQGGANTQVLRGALYTNVVTGTGTNQYDSPRALVAVSPEISIAAGSATSVRTVHLSSGVAVTAGDYWLAIWYGGTGSGALIKSDDKYRSKYTQNLAYHATNQPSASVTFTTDPDRDCPQAWFTYTVEPLPATPAGVTTIIPAELPASTLIVNPLTGPHYHGNKMHLTFSTEDGGTNYSLIDYDRWYMRDIVSADGRSMNWEPIDAKIAEAKARGRKYAFALRALGRGDQPNLGSRVPAYLTSTQYGWFLSTSGQTNPTFIPDWNNAFFLDEYEKWIRAAGLRYDGHPDIAWVDMTTWGSYGEHSDADIATSDPNYINGGFQRPTAANRQRMVNWYYQYFPTTPKVLHMADRALLGDQLRNRADLGYRPQIIGDWNGTGTQAWGSSEYTKERRFALYRSWMTAPNIGESIGPTHWPAGSAAWDVAARDAYKQVVLFHLDSLRGENWSFDRTSAQGRADWAKAYRKMGYRFHVARIDLQTTVTGETVTLTSYWYNRNVTPARHAWNVTWQLVQNGAVVAQVTSSLDLRTLLPTGLRPVADSVTFPAAGLVNGPVTVRLVISHVDGVWRNLRLGTAGLDPATGVYTLGTATMSVSTPEPEPPPPPTVGPGGAVTRPQRPSIQIVARDAATMQVIQDLSGRARETIIARNRHGGAWLRTTVPMRTSQAVHWLERPGLIWLEAWDGARRIWRGRLEDRTLTDDGLALQAFGPSRALTDLRYTAFWTSADVRQWRTVDRAGYQPGKYQLQVGANVLTIQPRKGESYSGLGTDAFGIEASVPAGSLTPFRTLTMTIRAQLPQGWTVRVLAGSTVVWSHQANLSAPSSTVTVPLNGASTVTIQLYGTGVMNAAATGDWQLVVTTPVLRGGTAVTSAITANLIAAHLVQVVSGTNPALLSSMPARIPSPGLPLSEEVYIDAEMSAVLQRLADLGDIDGQPWVWGVDDDLRLYLRPATWGSRTWIADAASLRLEVSAERQVSRVYATYSNQQQRLITAAAQDAQALAHLGYTRETVVRSQASWAGQAEAYRDTALRDLRAPTPRTRLVVHRLWTTDGAMVPLHEVRPLDTIRVTQMERVGSRTLAAVQIVTLAATEYHVDDGTLTIETAEPSPTLERLIAQQQATPAPTPVIRLG